MNTHSPKLPAVRLPSFPTGDGEHLVQDAVILDYPPFTKFSINYPSENEAGRPIPTPPSSDRAALDSSEGESEISSAEESSHELEATDTFDANHSPPISRLRPAMHGLNTSASPIPPHPRLPRAFTLPLPSQLGHLQHPLRPPLSLKSNRSMSPDSLEASQFKELSLELADSVQMVIQTMLQISPSQVLDSAKESFSACALAVPTPSMSAMFTAMKNLNYISANMKTFAGRPLIEAGEELPPLFSSETHNDFDIGELLQSTGDALSGAAAQVGVDLVLYHGDIGLKHVWVKGDESGISYLLSHVIRQVLNTAHRADSLEIGLFVRHKPKRQDSIATIASEGDEEDPFKEPAELDGPLHCSVEIHHKFGITEHHEGANHVVTRSEPILSSLLLRRLLHKVGAQMNTSEATASGRTCRVNFTLDAGQSPVNTPATVTSNGESIASEPTLEQLMSFAESLKGKKVHLYASSKGSFAHHLTSYLTAWGLDVSHINAESGVEDQAEPLPPSPTSNITPEGYTPSGVPPRPEPRQPKAQPISFIFIDDDFSVLKERLHALRPENLYPLNLSTRKRPSLAPHHRPRSTPQISRLAQPSASSSGPPAVILHFTSLSNFKLTKDVVQTALRSYQGTPFPVPEIMIIPKPAGPRRFLTALHSAVMKPAVDPFFSPIATTPGTPGIHSTSSSFFQGFSNHNVSPKSPSQTHRPSGSRSNSDRSAKSTNLEGHPHPSSPLAIPDPAEYFSDAAMKLGTSASSGLVIQSPDGQPAGIFFHPKARVSRATSGNVSDREKNNISGGPSGRKGSASSIRGNGDEQKSSINFSSLHEANAKSTKYSPLMNQQPGPSGLRSGLTSPVSPRILLSTSSTETQSSSISRRPSEITRNISSSPPASPKLEPKHPPPPSRRNTRRDSSALQPPLTSKKAKSPADSNIVPPISVLIVDDNPINRTVLATFMKRNKIKYDVASNGKEAVEKWRTGEFHLILMDIQMPVMDGMAATSEIRRIEKLNAYAGFPPSTPAQEFASGGPPTPSDTSASETTRSTASPYRSSVIIVALTASSSQSDRIAALAAGCNDFLTKPVSLQWLNNKLIEWGSLKALQMWADPPEPMARNQADQARNVANKLHVPKDRAVANATSNTSLASTVTPSLSSSPNQGKSPMEPPRTPSEPQQQAGTSLSTNGNMETTTASGSNVDMDRTAGPTLVTSAKDSSDSASPTTSTPSGSGASSSSSSVDRNSGTTVVNSVSTGEEGEGANGHENEANEPGVGAVAVPQSGEQADGSGEILDDGNTR